MRVSVASQLFPLMLYEGILVLITILIAGQLTVQLTRNRMRQRSYSALSVALSCAQLIIMAFTAATLPLAGIFRVGPSYGPLFIAYNNGVHVHWQKQPTQLTINRSTYYGSDSVADSGWMQTNARTNFHNVYLEDCSGQGVVIEALNYSGAVPFLKP